MRIQHLAFLATIVVTAAKPPSHPHRRAHATIRDAKPSNVVYVPAAIETVVKYVLDGHEITEEEVRQFCREHIAHYKVPTYYRFVEEYPMTITGKIQKYKIIEQMKAELGLD